MKTKIILILLFSVFLSCSKKEKTNDQFKYFDFSFDNSFETCFSIKFTPNDSIYMKEYWLGSYNNSEFPNQETNYTAIISKRDRKQLYDLIAKLQLEKYDSIYEEDYDDGTTYSFYIIKDSIKKSIYIHTYKDTAPKELDSLGKWIYNWKKKAKRIKINKNLTFKSSKYVLPPPLPIKGKTE